MTTDDLFDRHMDAAGWHFAIATVKNGGREVTLTRTMPRAQSIVIGEISNPMLVEHGQIVDETLVKGALPEHLQPHVAVWNEAVKASAFYFDPTRTGAEIDRYQIEVMKTYAAMLQLLFGETPNFTAETLEGIGK
jgi:hypothetical protein